MDWRIELQSDGSLMRVTTSGLFQLRQQQQMFDELGAHPAFSHRLPLLFDNREIDMSSSDINVIRQSVDILQEFMRKREVERVAGLVDAGVNFGVGRQFEILADWGGGRDFRLFNDEQLALHWLRGEPL